MTDKERLEKIAKAIQQPMTDLSKWSNGVLNAYIANVTKS